MIMYKTKLLPFAAVALLLGGISSSVAGQTRNPPTQPPVSAETVNQADISNVNAIEVSPGETNYSIATTYGETYYGETSGDESGYLFISINSTLPKAATASPESPGATADQPQPIEQASEVTGGSWTRQIFLRGKYIGSVYGRIAGGTLIWSQTDLSATVNLDLLVDNGTQAFVDRTGKGRFAGALDRMSKVPTISGQLTLAY
jgi:hypothetical protein